MRKEFGHNDEAIDNTESFSDKLYKFRKGLSAKKQLRHYEQALEEAEKALRAGTDELAAAEQQLKGVKHELRGLQKQTGILGDVSEARRQLNALRTELYDTTESLDLQEVGFYENTFNFIDSQQYKNELQRIREAQKAMLKSKTAVICNVAWEVNGSSREGKRMVTAFSNIVLRAFNGECDSCVAKVTYQNINKYEKRINSSFDRLNKWSSITSTTITDEYRLLKVAELKTAYEYRLKKQEEKEEQQRIREQMREEEKARQEIIMAEKAAEAREREYRKDIAAARHNLKLLRSMEEIRKQKQLIESLEVKLSQAGQDKQRAISQAQLTRAGHVYIISNVGAFGEHVYKIGMTRRLTPEDRVKELGDASVPFPFDIHAMIYSEDAPTLENMLHRHFENNKMNLVNTRREFFRVRIEDIEEALEKFKLVHPELKARFQLIKTAQAEQYFRSVAMREQAGIVLKS